jgi:cytochrome c peroxidase
MKNLLLLFIAIIMMNACKSEKKPVTENAGPVLTELQTKAKTIFGTLPVIAESSTNPVTDEKVLLGKTLYFDNILSLHKTQSCNSCHNLNTYGVDNLPTSPGDGKGTAGTRNSPTTLNAALHFAQFWDGREPDVEAQAGGPILNKVEMGMPEEKVVIERLVKEQKYKELFAKAFPDQKDPVNYENLKKAIGAFERKLITPAKFDDYLAGNDSALNDTEKKGLQLFIDKGCTTCHSGNVLGGNIYQKFGLFGNYWDMTKSKKIDKGRIEVTKNDADLYVFKAPSLRNIEKTYPYFHDGSISDLKQAVKIMGKLQLNQDLTEEEIGNIVGFMSTLTGEVPAEYKQ